MKKFYTTLALALAVAVSAGANPVAQRISTHNFVKSNTEEAKTVSSKAVINNAIETKAKRHQAPVLREQATIADIENVYLGSSYHATQGGGWSVDGPCFVYANPAGDGLIFINFLGTGETYYDATLNEDGTISLNIDNAEFPVNVQASDGSIVQVNMKFVQIDVTGGTPYPQVPGPITLVYDKDYRMLYYEGDNDGNNWQKILALTTVEGTDEDVAGYYDFISVVDMNVVNAQLAYTEYEADSTTGQLTPNDVSTYIYVEKNETGYAIENMMDFGFGEPAQFDIDTEAKTGTFDNAYVGTVKNYDFYLSTVAVEEDPNYGVFFEPDDYVVTFDGETLSDEDGVYTVFAAQADFLGVWESTGYYYLNSPVYTDVYILIEDQIFEITGVKDVLVADDSDAPVEYFNLQGVKVNNPENGLYIRRQGKTVTKVYVK